MNTRQSHPNVIVSSDDLDDATSWAARALPGRPTHPVLAGLMLVINDDGLTVQGYDYETAVSATIPATVLEPGRTLVSGKLLAAIAAAVNKGRTPSNVTITCADDGVHVKAGTSEWTLPTMNVEDYPQLPNLGEPIGTVNAGEFRRALQRTMIAGGKDATIAFLMAVKLDTDNDALTLTATDRFRVASAVVPWTAQREAPLDLLVPITTMELATRTMTEDSATVTVHGTDSGIGFATDTSYVVGRVLDEGFPAWQKIATIDPDHYVLVDVAPLRWAVDQALAIGEPNLSLDITPDGIALSSVGDAGRAHADAPVKELLGEPLPLILNPGYLKDGLSVMESDTARIHLGASPIRPVVFVPVDDDTYRYVTMPIRPPK